MKIRYKSLERNVFGDAPFVATRIGAIQCTHNCVGCYHRHLNDVQGYWSDSAEDIIESVVRDPFDEGIVLGGLEWTEQPEEMSELIRVAKDHGLKVMLYTHMGKEEFADRFGRPSGIYVKHGEFVAGGEPHRQYGVQLANREQYIIWYE